MGIRSVRLILTLVVFLLSVGCTRTVFVPTSLEKASPGINVRDYGAKGDGLTDDRSAIQAAIDAGKKSTILIPNGRYLIGQGKGYWGLRIADDADGTRLVGESRDGTVLLQAPVGPSVRLIQVEAANVTIESLTLSGQKSKQTTQEEHRAGIFATGAPDLTLLNVTSIDFTGDGFYIHIASDRPKILNVLASGNIRNGITFGGGTTGGQILNSVFRDNLVQQFDSEPGPTYTVDNLTISNSVFDGRTVSTDYAMTVAGSGAGWQSKGWTISGNTINGGTQIAWATDIDYRNNTCTSSTGPCVYVYRASARVTISGNHLALTGSPKAVVSVYGTGPAQMPEQIVIAGNTLETGSANAHGVCILSAHSVEVTDNVMTGNGVAAPYTSGVYARATIAGGDAKIESLQIKRNKISNFPAYGVMLTGIPGTMGLVDVSTNFFASDNSAMPSALWIDDGFGGPDDVRQYANTFNGTMQRLIGRAPNGSKTVWLDGSRWVK